MKFEEKLIDHLLSGHPTSVSEKAKNVAMIFVLNVLWVIGISVLLHWLSGSTGPVFGSINQNFFAWQWFTPPLKWDIFFACIMAPLWEELAFRVAPYLTARNLGREYLYPIIIFSVMLFGWGHGQGTISLLIQGVAGLGLTYAYIKNGYCYWSSVSLHCLWNSMCVFISQVG